MQNLRIVEERMAHKFLGQLKPLDIMRVLTMLGHFSTMAAIYQVFRELHPAGVKTLLGEPIEWLALDELERIESRFLSALGKLFPVEESATEEYLFGDFSEEGRGGFFVASLGPCLGWDDIEDLTSDPSEWNPAMSLPVFFAAICNEFDQEAWMKLARHFRWPFKRRPKLPNGEWVFDDSKLKKLLLKYGMTKYWIAWQVCAEDTGLPFFDINPNSEIEIPELMEANAENIRELEHLWRKKGEPMYEAYIETLQEVEAHPAMLKKLFKLMSRSIVLQKEREKKEDERKDHNP